MLKIWGRPNSICTQRVLWACVEADLAYDLVLASGTMGPHGHVSTGSPPFGRVDTPEYRAMNPNGTVPTVDDGGFVLWESNAIVARLAMQYAPERLYGGQVDVLARALQWMSWTNEHLEPPLHVFVMELVRLVEAKRDRAAAEAAAREILAPLAILDAHLGTQPWVAGPEFSLGDIPTGTAAYRWRLFVREFGLESRQFAALEEWQERLGARPGFRQHVMPRECHL